MSDAVNQPPKKARKSFTKRPKLKAQLLIWDEKKGPSGRFILTTPKTAKSARGLQADVVILLTDKIEKRDLEDIQSLQMSLSQSEIAACFYELGRVTPEIMAAAT